MEALQRVDKYLFLEEQERNSLGATWRAAALQNGKIDQYFLADVVSPNLATDAGFLEKFLNQSLVTAKLEHPNILKKITANHETGELISINEYQEGFSLEKVLDRCQSDGFPFSIDHALLVVSKLLSALSYAKSKQLSHGFVNPGVIFVTHEGEVKLKGFAFSAALRALRGTNPGLDPYRKYIPPSANITSQDMNRLDIFGCGAILYEMLTGHSILEGGGEIANRIANATTAADGEKLPPHIGKILVSALDPKAPTGYADIQKMAKDMEELLYSGEYSPTTFNLAFFMHSAFRTEMEELGERMAREKERDFSAHGTEAAGLADTVRMEEDEKATIILPDSSGEDTVAAPVETPRKSKLPIILGAVAGLAVVLALAFFFLRPKQEVEADKFEEQRARLQREAEQAEADRLRRQQEELERQNELLRQQLQQQAEAERDRKKQELEEEMKRMDQEIARLKALEEQERKTQELQAQLEALSKQREAKAEEERKLEEEAEAARIYKEQQANAQGAEANAEGITEPQDTQEPSGDLDSGGQENPAQPATADTEPASQPTGDQSQPPADSQTTPVEAAPVEAEPKAAVVLTPPREGEIVPLDDQLLEYPVLLESYETLDVPRRAIRDGVVQRDRTISFFVKALVNENGEVEDVELLRSPLPEDASDYGMINKALKAAKKVKFTPPTKMGVRVKVWMNFPIHFVAR